MFAVAAFGLPPALVRRARASARRLAKASRETRAANAAARSDAPLRSGPVFLSTCRVLAAVWRSGLVPRSCVSESLWLPQLVGILLTQLTPRQAAGAVVTMWRRSQGGETPLAWTCSASVAFAVAGSDLLLLRSPQAAVAIDRSGLGVPSAALLCLERLFVGVLPLPACLSLVDRLLDEGAAAVADTFVAAAQAAQVRLDSECGDVPDPEAAWEAMCSAIAYAGPGEASAAAAGIAAAAFPPAALVQAERRAIRMVSGTTRPWVWRVLSRCLCKAALWMRVTAAPLPFVGPGRRGRPLLPAAFPGAAQVSAGSGPAWFGPDGEWRVPSLTGYAWVGFDADFTVLEYVRDRLDAQVLASAVEALRAPLGAGAASDEPLSPGWVATRLLGAVSPPAHLARCGAVLDRELGNVLRLTAAGEVGAAWHGSAPLSAEDVAETYGAASLAEPAEGSGPRPRPARPGLRFIPGWWPPAHPLAPDAAAATPAPADAAPATGDLPRGEAAPLLPLHTGFEAPVASVFAAIVDAADEGLGAEWASSLRCRVVQRRRRAGWGGFRRDAGRADGTEDEAADDGDEEDGDTAAAGAAPAATGAPPALPRSYARAASLASAAVQAFFGAEGGFSRVRAHPGESGSLAAVPRLRAWLLALRKGAGHAEAAPKRPPRVPASFAAAADQVRAASRAPQCLPKAGPRLFLLSNGSWQGVSPLLTWALGPDWPALFDLVVVDANKRRCFAEPLRAARVSPADAGPVRPPAGRRPFDRVDVATGRCRFVDTTPSVVPQARWQGGSAATVDAPVSRAGRVARLRAGGAAEPASHATAAIPGHPESPTSSASEVDALSTAAAAAADDDDDDDGGSGASRAGAGGMGVGFRSPSRAGGAGDAAGTGEDDDDDDDDDDDGAEVVRPGDAPPSAASGARAADPGAASASLAPLFAPLPIAPGCVGPALAGAGPAYRVARHSAEGLRVWSGGNAWDLQATLAVAAPLQGGHAGVLYVGDHTGTDVTQPAGTMGWDTVAVQPSIEAAIRRAARPEARRRFLSDPRAAVVDARRASMAGPGASRRRHARKEERQPEPSGSALGWGGLEAGVEWAACSAHARLTVPSVRFWAEELQPDPCKPASLDALRAALRLSPDVAVSMAPAVPSVGALARMAASCIGDSKPSLGAPPRAILEAAKAPGGAPAPLWWPGRVSGVDDPAADARGQWRITAASATVEALCSGSATD